MVYSVIGTGAIGGYYGAKLAKAGKEVNFLLHSDYQYVLEHGLDVQSVAGSFTLEKVNAFSRPEDMPKSDVVLVCLKTVNNHLLASLVTPLLKEDTVIVLIQNGVGVEKDVQRIFPDNGLVAGLAFICCAKTEPGKVNHQSYGNINFGNYSCKDPEKFERIVEDFISSGVEAHSVEYNEARWKKAVWNMPFNGMTVALETSTDKLLSNPSTCALIKAQMLEVIRAAQASGVTNIDESFADKMINNTLAMPPYSPSMKLDYDFGRPMEIEYLYSRPIEIARASGSPMPKLEMLEAMLRFKQNKAPKQLD